MHISIYIYIYIYRERDVYTCIYIYIYIERERYVYVYVDVYTCVFVTEHPSRFKPEGEPPCFSATQRRATYYTPNLPTNIVEFRGLTPAQSSCKGVEFPGP